MVARFARARPGCGPVRGDLPPRPRERGPEPHERTAGRRAGQAGEGEAAGGPPRVAPRRPDCHRGRGGCRLRWPRRDGRHRPHGPAVTTPRVTRRDGRQPDDLRPVTFERDYTEFAMGSVLVSMGRPRVLCTASVEERIPPWLKGQGRGWVTAEYSMLPGSTAERVDREAARGKQSGRTQEIQRLIGRSLRSVCDMTAMPDTQIVVDCDVLQADGGTRTAAICGGYVALHDALTRLMMIGKLRTHPITEACAAISVGIVDTVPMLDLA